jgi:hypothetical protein
MKIFKIIGVSYVVLYLLFTFYLILSVGFPSLKFGDAFDRAYLVCVWGFLSALFILILFALIDAYLEA